MSAASRLGSSWVLLTASSIWPLGESSGILALSRKSSVSQGIGTAQVNWRQRLVVKNLRPSQLSVRGRTNSGKISQNALHESPYELDSPFSEYVPGPLDDLFFRIFREKMAEEVGWDSQKPGYDGLIEVVKYLYKGTSSKLETEKVTGRVLKSLFPGWMLSLFRQLILPVGDGRVAAVMTGVVTQATCQWLMGSCKVNRVTLADGTTLPSGVLVQRCKYLEESKCAGICTHTCKIPTQTFMKESMGVPLAIEPNFNDFSCQPTMHAMRAAFTKENRSSSSVWRLFLEMRTQDSRPPVYQSVQQPLRDLYSTAKFKQNNAPRCE